MSGEAVVLLDEQGVPRLTTDSDLERLRQSKGVRDNSAFLQTDFIPHFEALARDKARLADNTEDLLRAQGMMRLLHEQTVFITQKLKKQKGIV